MFRLKMQRIYYGDHGTFGVLIDDTGPICLTLENPWVHNRANVSCIPTKHGYYICKRIDSPHFGDTFEVTNVASRTHILFHKGNTEDDTRGCIILGSNFGELKGKPAVLGSKPAFDKFMRLLEGIDEFELDLRSFYG